MKLPKPPPNPADEWIKEIENEFNYLLNNVEAKTWIEVFRDFDASLGQHIDDVIETKNDKIIIPVLKRTSTLLTELKDKIDDPYVPNDQDAWLIDEILDKWEIIFSDHLDKWEQERKASFIAKLKQDQDVTC